MVREPAEHLDRRAARGVGALTLDRRKPERLLCAAVQQEERADAVHLGVRHRHAPLVRHGDVRLAARALRHAHTHRRMIGKRGEVGDFPIARVHDDRNLRSRGSRDLGGHDLTRHGNDQLHRLEVGLQDRQA